MSLSNLPPCDDELHKRGEHIATIWDLKPAQIEEAVKNAAVKSGQKIDWHYLGGRACVRALGQDLYSARLHLGLELIDHPDKYRFTTDQDSVLPTSLFIRE